MIDTLSKLACRIDTCRAERRQFDYRTGWPAITKPDIKFARVGGVQFRYRERGNGKPIVFSADPPVTLESYDEILDLYASQFRVIVFELPGMGFSAAGAKYQFGWKDTNDTVAEFISKVAQTPAILAFSCAAGLAATDIAVRYPALVEKLVLIQTGTPATFAEWKARRDPKKILARPFIGQWAMKRMGKQRLNDWFELVVANPKDVAKLSEQSMAALNRGGLWSLSSAYQRYLVHNVPLGVAEQPSLAIWGKKDRSHSPASWRSARGLAESVDIVTFDDVGHFPELEAPAQVAQCITDFAK
ncbi:MAG: alpha/beta hydrolase [Pseudomonadota bacterium]